MNFVYFYQAPEASWSSVIEAQARVFARQRRARLVRFRRAADPAALWRAAKLLTGGERSVVVINHSILALVSLPIRLVLRRHRYVLLVHEGEPMFTAGQLGSYAGRESRSMKLRASRLYHLVAGLGVEFRVVLTQRQGHALGLADPVQCNFLGADPEAFVPQAEAKDAGGPPRLFFPHRSSRPDKGFGLLGDAVAEAGRPLDVVCADGVGYERMPELYRACDVVVIPSVFPESYSLVLCEAMLSNCRILASTRLGLVQNLLERFSVDDLAEVGLFVFEPDRRGLLAALPAALDGAGADTRRFALSEGLTIEAASMRLIERLEDLTTGSPAGP